GGGLRLFDESPASLSREEKGYATDSRNDLSKQLQSFASDVQGHHGGARRVPSGRARLATSPERTGSAAPPMTMGIVRVAFCAALIAVATQATMTSTLSPTNSAARAAARSPPSSAQRYSTTILSPST